MRGTVIVHCPSIAAACQESTPGQLHATASTRTLGHSCGTGMGLRGQAHGGHAGKRASAGNGIRLPSQTLNPAYEARRLHGRRPRGRAAAHRPQGSPHHDSRHRTRSGAPRAPGERPRPRSRRCPGARACAAVRPAWRPSRRRPPAAHRFQCLHARRCSAVARRRVRGLIWRPACCRAGDAARRLPREAGWRHPQQRCPAARLPPCGAARRLDWRPARRPPATPPHPRWPAAQRRPGCAARRRLNWRPAPRRQTASARAAPSWGRHGGTQTLRRGAQSGCCGRCGQPPARQRVWAQGQGWGGEWRARYAGAAEPRGRRSLVGARLCRRDRLPVRPSCDPANECSTTASWHALPKDAAKVRRNERQLFNLSCL